MKYDEIEKLTKRGEFFTVAFIKRTTGEERVMNCRTGVKKHLKGGSAAYNFKEKNLLSVYDVQAEGYRCIPVDAVTRLTINGETHTFEE
jgi:hypothetical protein